MLVDTSIFIDYLRARASARSAIAAWRAEREVIMHAVVAAELIAGVRDRRELLRALALKKGCVLLVPDESDIRRALTLLERHGLADGVDWNDCLIAATALRLRVPVATLNEKHFRVFRGLGVLRPY